MDLEGSSTIDVPAILATLYPALYPALIDISRAELRMAGHDEGEAEDLVQAAATRWLEVVSTEVGAKSYMRKFIRRAAKNLNRPTRDAMSRHPLSLDAPLRRQIEEE